MSAMSVIDSRHTLKLIKSPLLLKIPKILNFDFCRSVINARQCVFVCVCIYIYIYMYIYIYICVCVCVCVCVFVSVCMCIIFLCFVPLTLPEFDHDRGWKIFRFFLCTFTWKESSTNQKLKLRCFFFLRG